jgi:hypothetical protein
MTAIRFTIFVDIFQDLAQLLGREGGLLCTRGEAL